MNLREILQSTTFGQRVAEQESDSLTSYFVETNQWRQLYAGDIDVVYGPKGSGKSALYFLLLSRSQDLVERGILLTAGENPQGAPAFKDLVKDPPAGEDQFRALWKLYVLSLVGELTREHGIDNDESRALQGVLAEAGLLEPKATLSRRVGAVLSYVRRNLPPASVSGGVTLVDPGTGQPVSVNGKITFSEPTPKQREEGSRTVDDLFQLADAAMARSGLTAWIVIDRLDVAFAETQELEQNALRALFRTYVDFLVLRSISLKLFLRDDIWRRITAQGFREGSHITRSLTISWDEPSLLNLIIRRALRNDAIRERYGVSEEEVLASFEKQQALFYRMLPEQVDVGTKRPKSLGWILNHTSDGTGSTAPRELIHLMEETRAGQLRRFERGEAGPSGDALFSSAAIKAAWPEVSRVRLQQTVYAEYPELKASIEALEGQKRQQSLASLCRIWGIDPDEARVRAQRLTEIGFVESTGSSAEPRFRVPFLYLPALHLVQGSAE